MRDLPDDIQDFICEFDEFNPSSHRTLIKLSDLLNQPIEITQTRYIDILIDII